MLQYTRMSQVGRLFAEPVACCDGFGLLTKRSEVYDGRSDSQPGFSSLPVTYRVPYSQRSNALVGS